MRCRTTDQQGCADDACGKRALPCVLRDKVVSVTENGVRGKQGELADMEPASAGTPYEPTDYKVTFVNPDTAIMTHGTKGADVHHSLHVWSRDRGGKWQIVATSTTPAAGTKK